MLTHLSCSHQPFCGYHIISLFTCHTNGNWINRLPLFEDSVPNQPTNLSFFFFFSSFNPDYGSWSNQYKSCLVSPSIYYLLVRSLCLTSPPPQCATVTTNCFYPHHCIQCHNKCCCHYPSSHGMAYIQVGTHISKSALLIYSVLVNITAAKL